MLKFLDLILDGGFSDIRPVFDPKTEKLVRYPEIEQALEKNAAFVSRLIEDLIRLGYLKRSFLSKMVICPVCNSPDLRYQTFCHKCDSPYIVKIKMLEHLFCNYVGKEEEFQNGQRLICPKCQKELFIIGDDYNSPGYNYRCCECGAISPTPKEKWFCPKCENLIEREELKDVILFSYKVNRQEIERLRRERLPRERIINILKKDGYEVEENTRQVGRSGAEHEIDILATKYSGSTTHRLVIGFSINETEIDSEDVIKLYAKGYDVNAQDVILVAIPKLSPDAENFARHYRIKVFEEKDLERLEEEFASATQ